MRDGQWETVLDRVLELTVLFSRDAAESLAREGLTESRAHLVWELAHRGPSTQAVLAERLRVTPRAITALVDALVDTGFVTREPHPSDRRATLVTFTERGRTAAQALVDSHRELACRLFGGLPDDVFDGFETGLLHVIAQFRDVIARKNAQLSNRLSARCGDDRGDARYPSYSLRAGVIDGGPESQAGACACASSPMVTATAIRVCMS